MIDLKRDLTIKEIIWYRHAMGLTMQELGAMFGVTKQSISNLENGRVKISRVYSIGYQAIYECLTVSEKDRLIREEIANLGLNYRDATEELIEKVKTKIKGA